VTVRKQMEGDSRERRAKAGEARREGELPSARSATTGASKQDKHLPRSADPARKLAQRGEGKQGGAPQERLARGRPRGGPPG
jgi:hypothetical protein